MSNPRRVARFTIAVISGVIALVGFVPTAASASSAHTAPASHGPGWCC